MFSPAHTQILLYQYFKNDSEDPLASKNRSDQDQERARNQLNRMIQGLNTIGFDPPVVLLLPPEKPRNYSYPQFEVRRANSDGPTSLVSLALQEAVKNYLTSRPGAFQFAGKDPWVSATYLITVRKDQTAEHLNFNQFLAVVVELPFGDLANLRSFLEIHNYEVLKKEFLNHSLWRLNAGDPEVSSMPTYVFVGREDGSSALGNWVMDIPTPVYDPHTLDPTKRSFVERGYPYVNYVVHERVDQFIQYHYEYVDLGLAVFLHSYLDRDTKRRLQTQADRLKKLMERTGEADERKLREDLEEFRKTVTEVATISNTVPEIEMMGKRLTQKYSSPDPQVLSIFQMVDSDNKEFLENSVHAVVEGTKVLQDQFLVLFEKRGQEHRNRVENFLKTLSAFAVVMVLKEIWVKDNAVAVFTMLGSILTRWHLHWPTVIALYPTYFYSSLLAGTGLFAILWLYMVSDERWGLHWSLITLILLMPLGFSTFVWLNWYLPISGFLVGLAAIPVISLGVGAWSQKRLTLKSRPPVLFLPLVVLPFYALIVLWLVPRSF